MTELPGIQNRCYECYTLEIEGERSCEHYQGYADLELLHGDVCPTLVAIKHDVEKWKRNNICFTYPHIIERLIKEDKIRGDF